MKNWELLKKIEEQKIRRDELAHKVCKSIPFISGVTTNRINPTDEEKEKLAEALNCKVKDIFKEG